MRRIYGHHQSRSIFRDFQVAVSVIDISRPKEEGLRARIYITAVVISARRSGSGTYQRNCGRRALGLSTLACPQCRGL